MTSATFKSRALQAFFHSSSSCCLAHFATLILFLGTSAQSHASNLEQARKDYLASYQAPTDSWEAWIQDLHRNAPKIMPRPDGKNPSLRLPLWVDCHLSWLFENRAQLPKEMSFPEELVLQSSSEDCSFQMERWSSPDKLKTLRKSAADAKND